jgi:hypothetical protein
MSSPGTFESVGRDQANALVVVGPTAGVKIPFARESRLGPAEGGGRLGGGPVLTSHHAVPRGGLGRLAAIEELGQPTRHL